MHAGHHSRALRSAGLARPGPLEHAARRRPPRARQLRPRPGGRAARASAASRSSCTSSRPGPRALARAARELRSSYGPPSTLSSRPAAAPIDVVHAHFGLTAWPALAVPARVRALTVHGTDVSHPRTRLATALVLPLVDLPGGRLAPASRRAARGRRAAAGAGAPVRRRPRALPADAARVPRAPSSASIRRGRYLLFPADPARAEKRHDRASRVAERTGAELLTLGSVGARPACRSVVNAANAVLVPSEREGFGLAVLEALACDVPVLATPVGIHPEALAGRRRRAVRALRPAPSGRARREAHLRRGGPARRRAGRAPSATRPGAMAERVLDAWKRALARSG